MQARLPTLLCAALLGFCASPRNFQAADDGRAAAHHPAILSGFEPLLAELGKRVLVEKDLVPFKKK